MTDLESAWLIAHAPARDAVDVLMKRRAMAALADAAYHLTRIVSEPITDYTDWDHLRTNVTHLVEPGLVRWTK